MNVSIKDKFSECRSGNTAALMPFLTAGYPNPNTFVQLLNAVSDNGADLIEIGIPFSDPLADGPTIQASSQIALKNDISIDRTFELISKSKTGDASLILMSYFNPIYQYGTTRFFNAASQIGINGLIIPDIILEEGTAIERLARQYSMDFIYLLSSQSGENRTNMILNRSRGFVYLVSVNGVTGARQKLPKSLNNWIKNVRSLSRIPVAVGFGISSVRQARSLAKVADGIIIGSALIDRISGAKSNKNAVRITSEFIRKLKKGISR